MKTANYRALGGGKSGARSHNAQLAESSGRLPASRAAKEWGFRSVSALQEWVSTREWHHVGRFASRIKYYDVAAFIEAGHDLGMLGANDLARALTKVGKRKVLPGVVRSIVGYNLNHLDPKSLAYHASTQRGKRPQRDATARLRELAKKHGWEGQFPWGENPVGNLDERTFVSWMDKQKAEKDT